MTLFLQFRPAALSAEIFHPVVVPADPGPLFVNPASFRGQVRTGEGSCEQEGPTLPLHAEAPQPIEIYHLLRGTIEKIGMRVDTHISAALLTFDT